MQRALFDLSPYHRLAHQRAYPPTLLTTSLSDDRVHPAHALKVHARLTYLEQPVWLLAPEEGGHSGNATQEQLAEETALMVRFFETHLTSMAQ